MAKYPQTGPPVDGRGGSLWNSNITFPVYRSHSHPHGGLTSITWAEFDSVFLYNEQINATAGICFGLCLLAFLNVIALTPKAKRALPLYTFILIALALLTARSLTLMILYTDLEGGSAYYNIAADYADGETVHSIAALVLVIWLPPLALLFVLLCLYVQGKCVLVLLALKHRYLYTSILSCLLTLSISTIILRMVVAGCVTVNQFDFNFALPEGLNIAALAIYIVTILSWSLVFTWQVGMVIFNRYQLGGPLDKNEGLAILFMTGIESMLIPMIFTILQLTHVAWFPTADTLVMPSIACIIPFGSVWASAANQHASLQRAILTNTAPAPVHCASCEEMVSNEFSHDNFTARNIPTSDSIISPSPRPFSPRISRFPGQPAPKEKDNVNENPHKDSTLSGSTNLHSDSHPSPNTNTNTTAKNPFLSSMPMTSSVLASTKVKFLNSSSSSFPHHLHTPHPSPDNHTTRHSHKNKAISTPQKHSTNVATI